MFTYTGICFCFFHLPRAQVGGKAVGVERRFGEKKNLFTLRDTRKCCFYINNFYFSSFFCSSVIIDTKYPSTAPACSLFFHKIENSKSALEQH